jgi:hypothetical protein
MRITKGLIIADPWIGYILGGTKDWEMRASGASHRGWFGLIRKGTGAIYGVARLIKVGTPLSPTEMITTFERHRIPEHMIRSGEVAKWNTPWKLADVRRLDHPVPYRHKSGAVTWVELDDVAIEGVAAVLRSATFGIDPVELVPDVGSSVGKTRAEVRPVEGNRDRSPTGPSLSASPATPKSNSRWIGEVVINDANLRHNHFYLRPLIDRFPADVIGGSNKSSAARGEVTIDWGGPEPVGTDIDGKDKKFFRARGWIGAFYKLHRAEAGDLVVIEETAPYRYQVSLKKPGLKVRGA